MSEQQGPPQAKIDVQKAVDWLNAKWQGPKICPVCHSNDWHVPDTLSEIRQFFHGSMVVGGPVFPLLLVTCKVCGHVLAFNALVMGLVERPQPEKAEATRE